MPTGGGGGGGAVSGLINSEPEVKPVVLRKRRQRIKSEANWSLFYYQFNCDHAKPNLIWNRKVSFEMPLSSGPFFIFFKKRPADDRKMRPKTPNNALDYPFL